MQAPLDKGGFWQFKAGTKALQVAAADRATHLECRFHVSSRADFESCAIERWKR